jgi:hypothetical protein
MGDYQGGSWQQPPAKPKRKRVVVGLLILVIGICLLLCAGIVSALSPNKSAEDIPPGATAHTIDAPSSAGGVAEKVAAPPAVAKPKPSPTKVSFTEGSYEVGAKSDPDANTVKAGTYTLSTQSHCYWERVRNFDGEFDSIIANGNLMSSGSRIITIKKTDAGINLSDDCTMRAK